MVDQIPSQVVYKRPDSFNEIPTHYCPGCTHGVAHRLIAEEYNGEWIAADGPVPFVLEGWVSAGLGREYDATLSKGGVSLEACDCRAEGNEITR